MRKECYAYTCGALEAPALTAPLLRVHHARVVEAIGISCGLFQIAEELGLKGWLASMAVRPTGGCYRAATSGRPRISEKRRAPAHILNRYATPGVLQKPAEVTMKQKSG